MRPDDMLEYLRKQPFQPFRIHLTNGASYEIRHPELMKVGRSQAFVFFHKSDDPHALVLRQEGVALLHINRVEPLASTSAPANGEGGSSA
jgi:hypothetical protein